MTKETGFYWVRYTCRNCGKTIDVKVSYGQRMPVYSFIEKESGYIKPAPECENCGCRMWSIGKAL